MSKERLRVWLVQVTEPCPTDGDGVRLLRTGMFAEVLAAAGHDVLWWTSSFLHGSKVQRFDHDQEVAVSENYRIRFVYAPSYSRNLSYGRLRHHRAVASNLRRQLDGEPEPDVIVASFPTPELCAVAADYGCRHRIPVIVDIRDLWPDFLYTLAPNWARPLAKAALWPMKKSVRRTLSQAAGIVGISPGFLEWGARMAGRELGPKDAHFPLGYTPRPPSEQELRSADAFWDGLGVSRGEDEFIACYFGMMGECDDMATCIEASRLLRGTGRRFRFVLAGTGPRLEEYQRAAADLDHVLFPGWVDKAQIWSLLRRARVGLIPVRPGSVDHSLDAIPNKAHDYLCAGLPVLSAYPGDMARFLRTHECGIVIEPGDPTCLTESLIQLYDDRQRYEKLSANARQAFEDHLHGDRVYRRYMAHVETVAACLKARSEELAPQVR